MTPAVVSIASTAVLPETPYKGLTPYTEEDAPFFFGRDTWREIIIDNLKAYRLTLLYGESGVGKSSVLRASVAHHLREEEHHNFSDHGVPDAAVAVFSSWRDDPLGGLLRCLDEAAADALGGQHDDGAPPTDLEAALERCSRRVGGRVYVILDQFEEYFLYHPAHETDEPFAAALPAALARQDLRVSFLLSIREDAVAKLDRFKGRIPNLFDNYLRIEHLDREAAREAIERPLERYNALRPEGEPVEIEPELIDAVIDDVGAGKFQVGQTGNAVQPGAHAHAHVEAPYLQLVMTRLWSEELAGGSRVLRVETLDRLGGAEGIIGTHLDAAMSALSPAERDTAAKAFRYLVTRSRTKIAHSVSDLSYWTEVPEAQLAPVLATLAGGDARILRPVGESSYEIYHDVLAEAVLVWRANHEAQRRSEEERREAEARNRRRLLKAGAVIALIGFVATLFFAVLALVERNRANREAKIASSRELAASALTQSKTHPDISLVLAHAALDKHPTAEAVSALRQALLNSNADVVLTGHPDLVSSAAFSPDARRALTAGRDGTARVWDTAGGRQLKVLRQEDAIADASFSPDGRRILTWGENGTARLRSAASGRVLAKLAGMQFSPTFSQDGRWIVGATFHRTQLREAATGDLVTSLKRVVPDSESAVSPDGRFVVAAQELPRRRGVRGRFGLRPYRARVWSTATGRPVTTLGRVAPFPGPKFSPDGRLVLAMTERGPMRVWNAETGRPLATFGHPGLFPDPEFSPDGRLVLSPAGNGRPQVWNAASGRLVAPLRRAGTLEEGEFSPDGRLVLTTSTAGTVRLWNGHTGRLVKTLVRAESGATAQFSADGRLILTTSRRGTGRLWTTDTGRAFATLRGFGQDPQAGFSENGRFIIATSNDTRARIWRVPRREAVVVLRHPDIASGCGYGYYERRCGFSASFSPDGALVLTAGGGSSLARLWDPVSGSMEATLRGHRKPIIRAAFSPSGELVVTASRDGTARIWDTASGREVGVLRGHDGPVRSAEFSRDGKLVATASRDGTAGIWRTRTGKLVEMLGLHSRPMSAATFSGDGSRVATLFEDGTARIWETATGRPVALLRRGRHLSDEDLEGTWLEFPAASFSADGSLLVAATSDGAARVWSVAAPGQRRSLSPRMVLLPKQNNFFNSVDFNRDGSLVVAASDDGTAHLWDPAEVGGGTRLIHISSQDDSVAEARFSTNGQLIVTAGGDGATRLWDVATKSELTALRNPSFASTWSAEFSPDGARIVTADTEGKARIYTCEICGSLDSLLDLADERKGRRLTAAERRLYLHEE